MRVGMAVGYPSLPMADTISLAQEAEAGGLALVGAGDGMIENCATLGALAMRTERIELFSSILGWSRSPVTTAVAGTTLQDLSGGRYRLGLGTMPKQWSEDWHGVPHGRPAERMRDFVAAIRTAWQARPQRPVDHDGTHYRIAGYTRQSPVDVEPPPIHLGVTLPKMSELAGEVADGAIVNAMTSAAWLEETTVPAVARGLERSGRTWSQFDLGRLIYCAIDDDPAVAVGHVKPALAFYLDVPYFARLCEEHGFGASVEQGRAARRAGDATGAAAAISDEMVRAFALAGTPEQVREQLAAYAPRLDFALLAVPLGCDGETTRRLARRIVATFGER